MLIQQHARFSTCCLLSLLFITFLWIVLTLDVLLTLELNQYTIYPRDINHLSGILLAPLVHASTEHLFANSAPTLVMLSMVLYLYPVAARRALPLIYLGSGIGVWLFARESFHFGASGLSHGLMFFLFLIGVIRRDRPSVALALIVFFLYGSMIWGILPTDPSISFESHFFGALTGVIAAVWLRKHDRRQPEKTYRWETQDEEDPIIGDAWKQPPGYDETGESRQADDLPPRP